MAERLDVRIEDDLPIKVTILYDEFGRMIPCEVNLEMKIKNLSAAGALVESEYDLAENSSFMVKLELNDNVIDLVFYVLRKIKPDNDDGKWLYGCKFEGIEMMQEQILRKYIFEKELMNRRGNNNGRW